MAKEKLAAISAVDEKAEPVSYAADRVWEFAELSLQEERSAALYCEALEREGFAGRSTGGV